MSQASRFELGVVLPNSGEQASAGPLARIGEAAEELGFDHVWVSETTLVPEEFGGGDTRTLDPFASLAYLTGRLGRIKLGTSIVRLPLHHPVHLAKQTASLQELSGGRLILGVGVGYYEPEFRLLGERFEDRGRRTDEALRLLRAVWAGERDFRGEYWSFENVRLEPRPTPLPRSGSAACHGAASAAPGNSAMPGIRTRATWTASAKPSSSGPRGASSPVPA